MLDVLVEPFQHLHNVHMYFMDGHVLDNPSPFLLRSSKILASQMHVSNYRIIFLDHASQMNPTLTQPKSLVSWFSLDDKSPELSAEHESSYLSLSRISLPSRYRARVGNVTQIETKTSLSEVSGWTTIINCLNLNQHHLKKGERPDKQPESEWL